MSEDILNKYTQLREELQVIQKSLFEVLVEHDIYNIIRHSDACRLSISEHPNDASLVRIAIKNHSDELAIMTWEAPRQVVLMQDEAIIELWHNAAQAEIIKTLRAKLMKFLRDFERSDFELISNAIQSYDALINRGQPHSEIARIVATVTAKKMGENKLKSDVQS